MTMTIPTRPVDHDGFADDPRRHRGAAALGRTAAHGTIQSIGATTFVLGARQGQLAVITSADTHG